MNNGPKQLLQSRNAVGESQEHKRPSISRKHLLRAAKRAPVEEQAQNYGSQFSA